MKKQKTILTFKTPIGETKGELVGMSGYLMKIKVTESYNNEYIGETKLFGNNWLVEETSENHLQDAEQYTTGPSIKKPPTPSLFWKIIGWSFIACFLVMVSIHVSNQLGYSIQTGCILGIFIDLCAIWVIALIILIKKTPWKK